MNLFWVDGYHATSARSLAKAMDLNLATLYSEFGSKKGLYRAAVARLSHHLVATLIGLFVMTRAQVSPSILDDVAASGVEQINAFARDDGIELGN